MRYKLLFILTILGVTLAACGGAPAALSEPALNVPTTEPVAVPISQSAEGTNTSGFTLTSPDLPADGRLPIEYTCDGDSSTLALAWSGDPSRSGNESGLGLAIAKSIVELHGGNIRAESGENGSAFSIILPAQGTTKHSVGQDNP